jgi:hypothetical protein
MCSIRFQTIPVNVSTLPHHLRRHYLHPNHQEHCHYHVAAAITLLSSIASTTMIHNFNTTTTTETKGQAYI